MAAIKTLKKCVHCERSVYRLAARGLCPACYYREKRNGSLEYVKVRKPCAVDGCDNLSISHGYCGMHTRRLQRHGVLESERFDKWGHTTKHPLYDSYRWITRNYAEQIDPRWGDFWKFVADVGERPSAKHRLVRTDRRKPFSPENVHWRPPALSATMAQLEGAAGYQRAYRAANPQRFKDYDLRRTFGLSAGQYEAMAEAQGHVCAICQRPERSPNLQTGLPRRLAVDHCHNSRRVRALLCTYCNTGLGSFEDDPDRLRAAIEYLERHAQKETPSDEG
jgi:hypothetical protein